MNSKLLINFQINRVEEAILTRLNAEDMRSTAQPIDSNSSVYEDATGVLAFYTAIESAAKRAPVTIDQLNDIVQLGSYLLLTLPVIELSALMNALKAVLNHQDLLHRHDIPLQWRSCLSGRRIPSFAKASCETYNDPFLLAMMMGGTMAFALTGNGAALLYPDPPID
jgi:hypothetical protein